MTAAMNAIRHDRSDLGCAHADPLARSAERRTTSDQRLRDHGRHRHHRESVVVHLAIEPSARTLDLDGVDFVDSNDEYYINVASQAPT